MNDDAVVDGAFAVLFPAHAIQTPTQKARFVDYCAQRLGTAKRGGALLRRLLQRFRVDLVVVGGSSCAPTTADPEIRAVRTAVPTTDPLGDGGPPPASSDRVRVAADTKKVGDDGDGTASRVDDDAAATAAAVPPSVDTKGVSRMNRLFAREEQKRASEARLRQFLRTGIRSDISRGVDAQRFEGVGWIPTLRDGARGQTWAKMSAWHRLAALRAYVSGRGDGDGDGDDPGYAARARAVLDMDAESNLQIRAVRALPPPAFDVCTGTITRLAPARKAASADARRRRRRPGNHTAPRPRPPTGGRRRRKRGDTAMLQCREQRRRIEARINRTVRFTGDFVRTNL